LYLKYPTTYTNELSYAIFLELEGKKYMVDSKPLLVIDYMPFGQSYYLLKPFHIRQVFLKK